MNESLNVFLRGDSPCLALCVQCLIEIPENIFDIFNADT